MPNKFNWPTTYPSIWSDVDQRYEQLKKAYDCLKDKNFSSFDDQDFTYFTKMLFENGHVFCSEKAWELIVRFEDKSGFTKDELSKLNEGGVQDTYLQSKTQNFRRKTNNGTRLKWEHVVPTKVIIDELLEEGLTPDRYKWILEFGVVCIVTEDEDKLLNDNGLRQSMPDNWHFDDVWARYKKAEIKVHGVKY